MSSGRSKRWRELAERQRGVVTRAQLADCGIYRNHVRSHIRAQRWQALSGTVIATTTGPPSFAQLLWAGVLHAGRPAAVGGLTALGLAGLQGWDRPKVTVMIPKSDDRLRLEGIDFVETRRDIAAVTQAGSAPPRLTVEAAALLFAAYVRSERTAVGLLAAVVQQRLTSVDRLESQLGAFKPLRRAPLFRETLTDIAGGAQSAAEVDLGRVCRRFGLALPHRQRLRTDRWGRRRYTDAEWDLEDGRTVVLEVDGAFHMDAENWWADMERERELVVEGRIVLRCSAFELRTNPGRVARDLRAVGVPLAPRPVERGA